jgi:hypothetical protein
VQLDQVEVVVAHKAAEEERARGPRSCPAVVRRSSVGRSREEDDAELAAVAQRLFASGQKRGTQRA